MEVREAVPETIHVMVPPYEAAKPSSSVQAVMGSCDRRGFDATSTSSDPSCFKGFVVDICGDRGWFKTTGRPPDEKDQRYYSARRSSMDSPANKMDSSDKGCRLILETNSRKRSAPSSGIGISLSSKGLGRTMGRALDLLHRKVIWLPWASVDVLRRPGHAGKS